jgi:rSAM/selenodomain-associated transferase 2
LPTLLAQLRQQQDVELEIVVADGGSGDATIAVAEAGGATVARAERGRGRQMNAGARASRSGYLLFLHADSQLPQPRLLAEALAALRAAGARVAGHFPLRFARGASEHALFYRYLEGKTRLNRPYTINGDQGLLIARPFFDELGGFDELAPFLEDQRLAAKIFAQGRFIVLPGELITSARRFETEGVRERYTLMALIMGLHAGGADAFFATAPQIYRAPSGRLALGPYLETIDRYLRELDASAGLRLWWRVGGFVRDNAWQLCYRRDVLRDDGQLRWLAWHDRFMAPLLANPLARLVAAALTRAWFSRLASRHRRSTPPAG